MSNTAKRLTEPLDDDAVSMGALLRRRRRALGLTLEQVAAESGLSHSFISLVERGRTRPSMLSFTSMARALQSTPMDLFAELPADGPTATGVDRPPGTAEVHVTRASHHFPTFAEGGGRLIQVDPGKIRVMEVRSERHGRQGLLTHDDHVELLIVLEGRIEVLVGDEILQLGIGDSIRYPPGTPHNWSSSDDKPSRILVIQY